MVTHSDGDSSIDTCYWIFSCFLEAEFPFLAKAGWVFSDIFVISHRIPDARCQGGQHLQRENFTWKSHWNGNPSSEEFESSQGRYEVWEKKLSWFPADVQKVTCNLYKGYITGYILITVYTNILVLHRIASMKFDSHIFTDHIRTYLTHQCHVVTTLFL